MILLLGGAQETYAIAEALLAAGRPVIVSTATDTPLVLPVHEHLRHRSGRLDEVGMLRLLQDEAIKVLVDATHPYAAEAHRTARAAADRVGVRYVRWVRPSTDLSEYPNVFCVATHEEGARIACSIGRTILLTVGSRNLAPYRKEAQRCGCRMIARVLPAAESLDACRKAGLTDADIIAARGPFSLEDNRALLRRFNAQVIVTKDGGAEGGVPAKLEAAKLEDCQVVLVMRPVEQTSNPVHTLEELVRAVLEGTEVLVGSQVIFAEQTAGCENVLAGNIVVIK